MSLEYVLNTPIVMRAPYRQRNQIEEASCSYKVIFVRHLPGGEGESQQSLGLAKLGREAKVSGGRAVVKDPPAGRQQRNVLLQIHR